MICSVSAFASIRFEKTHTAPKLTLGVTGATVGLLDGLAGL